MGFWFVCKPNLLNFKIIVLIRSILNFENKLTYQSDFKKFNKLDFNIKNRDIHLNKILLRIPRIYKFKKNYTN